jgi:toxin-antitoxin system PIN domain toxin
VILPDVNVLVYAFRADSDFHPACKEWLEGVRMGDARFGLSLLTLSALVRIVTNPKIYRQPAALAEVFAFADGLLAQPHCDIVEPGERHWSIFRKLCVETNTRGPKVTDVWFAALAIEHGCTWITYDRDYARFPGLEWRTPSAG